MRNALSAHKETQNELLPLVSLFIDAVIGSIIRKIG